jgi:hypothetical protein
MARVQLFLSAVSAEFLSYRERLRHLLTRPDVEVKVQEGFIVTGDETLEMIDTYIQSCDGVWLALRHGKRLFIALSAPEV